eukprot:g11123.t1 g11123   contig5:158004-158919(+)
MSDGNNDWCTIESDPGVFTSLIESFGVKNVELSELWSLDDESLLSLTNPMEGVENASVHGLIFLFKWQSSHAGNTNDNSPEEETGKALVGEDVPNDLFFAKQGADEKVVDDENGRRLVLGSTLSNFKSFTSHFPPDLRGEAIGSSDEIRTAHNSFGRAEDAFLSDPSKPKRIATDDDDVFHFVAYVPNDKDECVYELDGLKEGPIRVGSYKKEGEDGNSTLQWVQVARDSIQNRLSHYSPTEIKFNLMAMVQDRRTYLTERLNSLAAIGRVEVGGVVD